MSLSRRVRFLYVVLLVLLGTLLYATLVDWQFVMYYLIGYLAMFALVELLVAPVWRVRWNRRTYLVLLVGLVVFLGFAWESIVS